MANPFYEKYLSDLGSFEEVRQACIDICNKTSYKDCKNGTCSIAVTCGARIERLEMEKDTVIFAL